MRLDILILTLCSSFVVWNCAL